MGAVKQELERMETLGVISKIQEPTDWCSGMVVVPKADGKVRICVDLTRLNQSVHRERHPLPAVDQVLAQLAGANVLSKPDANSEFWQFPLTWLSQADNIHHSLWSILFQPPTLRNLFCS